MSESEGKQELVGFARSIDALFAGVTVLAPTSDAPASPEMEESSTVESVIDDAPFIPEPPRAEEFETPEAESLSGVVAIDGEAAPVGESSPPGEPSPIEEAGLMEEMDPVAVSLMDEEPQASIDELPVENVDYGEDEEASPTPLDLAVDAYIGGDLDKAAEIEMLADDLVKRKEIEPVARAVAQLALAAGLPRDESVYAVAESIMSPVVLGRLARRIGSERNEDRRKEYFIACRVIGEDMAVAIRDDLADSTDRLARRIHYDALVGMGDASRKVIEDMAVDENRFLVRNAVAILGDVGGERAVELVTSALANPDARVRREALLSLAKLGDQEAGHLVVGLLDDPDADVRVAAVIAAGELKVERALRSMISMLDSSSDPDDALRVIRALGQLGDPGAVASIEKYAVRSLFSKPRTDVRITAYRALNQIGTPHARRLVNQAVSDKDEAVKAAVREMLNMR